MGFVDFCEPALVPNARQTKRASLLAREQVKKLRLMLASYGEVLIMIARTFTLLFALSFLGLSISSVAAACVDCEHMTCDPFCRGRRGCGDTTGIIYSTCTTVGCCDGCAGPSCPRLGSSRTLSQDWTLHSVMVESRIGSIDAARAPRVLKAQAGSSSGGSSGLR